MKQIINIIRQAFAGEELHRNDLVCFANYSLDNLRVYTSAQQYLQKGKTGRVLCRANNFGAIFVIIIAVFLLAVIPNSVIGQLRTKSVGLFIICILGCILAVILALYLAVCLRWMVRNRNAPQSMRLKP